MAPNTASSLHISSTTNIDHSTDILRIMSVSYKRHRVMGPRVHLPCLADSEIHVVCRFLNVADHCRFGQTCRQLHYSCSKPAAWQYFVDQRLDNATTPPASFWAHVGHSMRVLVTYQQARDTYNLVNARALTNLLSLHALHIPYRFPSGAMMRALTDITTLRTLTLNNTLIKDVSALANLSTLHGLDLTNTRVSDASPLAGLTALQTLNLSSTYVTDVTPLAGLTALQTLNLSSTFITDVIPLAGLTALQTLNLQNSPVADVSPLVGCSILQTLYLDYTNVTDVSPLTGLRTLQTLDLDSTLVTDVSPLANLTALKTLHLRFTRVRDVSSLANLKTLQIVK